VQKKINTSKCHQTKGKSLGSKRKKISDRLLVTGCGKLTKSQKRSRGARFLKKKTRIGGLGIKLPIQKENAAKRSVHRAIKGKKRVKRLQKRGKKVRGEKQRVR